MCARHIAVYARLHLQQVEQVEQRGDVDCCTLAVALPTHLYHNMAELCSIVSEP